MERNNKPQTFKHILAQCHEVDQHLKGNTDDKREAETEMAKNSEERRQILSDVLQGLSSENPLQLLKENVNILKNYKNLSESELCELLDIIFDFIEDIDLALAFQNMQAFPIISDLLKGENVSIRISCLKIIGAIVQNNEKCLEAVTQENWLITIMNLVKETSSNELLSSSVTPISSLLRYNDNYNIFMKNQGIQILVKFINTNIERCMAKSAFVIYTLVEENPSRKIDFHNKDLVEILARRLTTPHQNFKEHFAKALLSICNKTDIFLNNVVDCKRNIELLIYDAKKHEDSEAEILLYKDIVKLLK